MLGRGRSGSSYWILLLARVTDGSAICIEHLYVSLATTSEGKYSLSLLLTYHWVPLCKVILVLLFVHHILLLVCFEKKSSCLRIFFLSFFSATSSFFLEFVSRDLDFLQNFSSAQSFNISKSVAEEREQARFHNWFHI